VSPIAIAMQCHEFFFAEPLRAEQAPIQTHHIPHHLHIALSARNDRQFIMPMSEDF